MKGCCTKHPKVWDTKQTTAWVATADLNSLPVFVPQWRKGHGVVPQTSREAQRFGRRACASASLPTLRFPVRNKRSHFLPDQRIPGDSQEVVKLVLQAVQCYERKLKDFYTHLRYSPPIPSVWSFRCINRAATYYYGLLDTGRRFSLFNSCFTLSVALHQTKLRYWWAHLESNLCHFSSHLHDCDIDLTTNAERFFPRRDQSKQINRQLLFLVLVVTV